MTGFSPAPRQHAQTVAAGPRHAPGRAGRKETTMLNLAFALIPGLGAAGRDAPTAETEEGFLGKLALRARARVGQWVRYHQALRELRRLDDRDLDDLGLGRGDLPGLARRHARGAAARAWGCRRNDSPTPSRG